METCYFVMEFCSFPTLDMILKHNNLLKEQKVRSIMKNLLEAVSYIHSCHICHRDLKPDNILVNQKTEAIKIIDFGVSSHFIQSMWTKTGNVCYGAPEIHTKCGYNEKVDIWSLGIVMFQLLTGCLPFQEQSVLQTIHNITNLDCNDHWELNQFKQLQIEAQDLLKRMLDRNSESRLSAEQCLQHNFLKQSQLIGNFYCTEELQNLEDQEVENSLNSSFDKNREIHHVKEYRNGKIDLVATYRVAPSNSTMSLECEPNLYKGLRSCEEIRESYQKSGKSNSYDFVKVRLRQNKMDESFDRVSIRLQKQEISGIVDEEEEPVEQILD